jgi:hypothetical protein
MFSQGSDAVAPTFRRSLSRLPSIAFALTILLDVIGRFLDTGFIDQVAGWLGRLALCAFGLLLVASLGIIGRQRGVIRWTPAIFGLLLGLLAAWVRGHPAVPADLPVIGANVLVLLLLVWAVRQPRFA